MSQQFVEAKHALSQTVTVCGLFQGVMGMRKVGAVRGTQKQVKSQGNALYW
jgi:hypothetical protein